MHVQILKFCLIVNHGGIFCLSGSPLQGPGLSLILDPRANMVHLMLIDLTCSTEGCLLSFSHPFPSSCFHFRGGFPFRQTVIFFFYMWHRRIRCIVLQNLSSMFSCYFLQHSFLKPSTCFSCVFLWHSSQIVVVSLSLVTETKTICKTSGIYSIPCGVCSKKYKGSSRGLKKRMLQKITASLWSLKTL